MLISLRSEKVHQIQLIGEGLTESCVVCSLQGDPDGIGRKYFLSVSRPLAKVGRIRALAIPALSEAEERTRSPAARYSSIFPDQRGTC